MKQIKLNGVLITEEEAKTAIRSHQVSAALSNQIIEDLQAQLDAPEPVEFWEGQLVIGSNGNSPQDYGPFFYLRFDDESQLHIARSNSGGLADMRRCYPLQDPLILQFKPHKPGDPMPCDKGLRVHIKYNGGSYWMTQLAGSGNWNAAIGWMPAAGWGGAK